jgi:hypothetical protein
MYVSVSLCQLKNDNGLSWAMQCHALVNGHTNTFQKYLCIRICAGMFSCSRNLINFYGLHVKICPPLILSQSNYLTSYISEAEHLLKYTMYMYIQKEYGLILICRITFKSFSSEIFKPRITQPLSAEKSDLYVQQVVTS